MIAAWHWGRSREKNTEDFEEKYEFARPLNTKKLEQEEVTFLIVESAVGGGFISVGRSLGKTRRVGKVAEKLDVLWRVFFFFSKSSFPPRFWQCFHDLILYFRIFKNKFTIGKYLFGFPAFSGDVKKSRELQGEREERVILRLSE